MRFKQKIGILYAAYRRYDIAYIQCWWKIMVMILPPISSNCHHHTITNLILLLTSFHRVTKNSLNLSSEWIITRNKFSLRLCPKLHGNSERFSLDCTCKRMLIWQTRWMCCSYQGVGQIKWYCVTHIVWVIHVNHVASFWPWR